MSYMKDAAGRRLDTYTPRDSADNGYLMACFRAASGDVGGDQKLSLMFSTDGKTFFDTYAPQYSPTAPKVVRDPSIIFLGGTFYVCHTNTGATGTSFDIISSTDLFNWTLIATVDVSSIGSVSNTWAPEFVVDGTDVYVVFSINIQDPYWVKATNAALTTWTSPTLMTVTGRPTQIIDPTFIKRSGTWYCFYKAESATASNRFIQRATASSPMGPYATDKTGDWAGWGTDLEGPEIIQLADGTYRLYMDSPNATTDLASYYYSDSTDLTTWSAKKSVARFPGDIQMKIRHGSVLPLTRDARLIAENFGRAYASPRFVGKETGKAQLDFAGVYAGYNTNGSVQIPFVTWANGGTAHRAQVNSSGQWVFDRPGIGSSDFFRLTPSGSAPTVMELGDGAGGYIPVLRAKKKMIECTSNVTFTSTTYANFSNVTGTFTPYGTKVGLELSGVLSPQNSGGGYLDTLFQVVVTKTSDGSAVTTVGFRGGLEGQSGARTALPKLVAQVSGLTAGTSYTFTLQAQNSAAGNLYCRPQNVPTEALTLTVEEVQ